MRPLRVRLISLLFLGAALLLQEPLRHGALSVLRFPFTLVKAAASTLLLLPRLPSLTGDNVRLRSELTQRALELATLREALRHAQRGQELLEAVPTPHGVVARIISRSTIPTEQTVLLDRGARHGLSVESIIVDAAGVVGRVIDLQPATCLVMLLTDPDSRVAGIVERSRESGLLIGRGNGQCDLIYLNAEADLVEGDHLLTAGLGGSFPKGLLLGTVTRVIRDEQLGTARAVVRVAARLGQLEEVLCLPPS